MMVSEQAIVATAALAASAAGVIWTAGRWTASLTTRVRLLEERLVVVEAAMARHLGNAAKAAEAQKER